MEFRPHPPKPNKIEEQRSQPTEELDREPDSLDRPEATPGAKASAGPSQTFLTGSIRLSGFQNAEFEPGRGVLCEAPPNENLQLDTKEETTFSKSKVTTHLFQAYLSAEGGLVSATTRGALKFFVQQKKAQPTKKLASGLKPVSSQAAKPAPLVLQSFAGSAANLLYNGETQVMELKGPYDTSFDDPELFAKPLHLVGGKRDTMSRLFKEEKFNFDSPDKTSYIEGTPLPVDSKSVPILSKPSGKKKG